MYKNQLQELAQRSCFNLPSYACVREGPDHAPRFKATVNFNGEVFESPTFFSTLRLAEHAAAEVALNTLAERGPSRTLAAKVLDETGVYKNLLQETAHRAGLNLPVYTTLRSGPGHVPVFSSTVELGGMSFTGELAKTKKQAQKNAAMSAWYALKQMSQRDCSPSPSDSKPEEQEHVAVARFLANLKLPESSDRPQCNPPKAHPKPPATFKSSFPPTSRSVDSRYQNQASSNLTPEMAAHHMWLQKQAAEYQRHLMALGVSMPPVPPPRQVVPWMHPYCLTAEQKPFSVAPLYFSNQLVQYPVKTRSMVTIQEIQAENPGNISKLSPSDALITGKNSSCVTGEKIEGTDNNSPENENTTSASLEIRKKESSEHASRDETKSRKPFGVESSRPNPKMTHAPTSSYPRNIGTASTTATPVGYNPRNFRPTSSAPRMPSGVNSFPARPMFGRMQAGGFHAPFMAPAVQIRSVVPVCSAAPPRKMNSSAQERPSTAEMKNNPAGDVSSATSDLENLRI
ncbi:hypothetical protein RND81_04G200700 [Saponaria officinalis]|uniref:DRBM domain-containing protein n=1 Tax=Saponaria officinalis TaxID=3572 RepID=A0AAW1LJR6_SAPOF